MTQGLLVVVSSHAPSGSDTSYTWSVVARLRLGFNFNCFTIDLLPFSFFFLKLTSLSQNRLRILGHRAVESMQRERTSHRGQYPDFAGVRSFPLLA